MYYLGAIVMDSYPYFRLSETGVKLVADQQTELNEIQKIGNLIAAAYGAAADWALYNSDSPFTPEDVLADEIELHLLTDPKAKLLEKATGWKTVLFKSTGPVSGWLPERMSVQVAPAYLQMLKKLVLQCVAQMKTMLQERMVEVAAFEQRQAEEAALATAPIPDEPQTAPIPDEPQTAPVPDAEGESPDA